MSDKALSKTTPNKGITPQPQSALSRTWFSKLKTLLKSPQGWVGIALTTEYLWTPLFKRAYYAIDAWGNLKMIYDYLPSIWKLITSSGGRFAVMVLGLSLIALQLYRQDKRVENKALFVPQDDEHASLDNYLREVADRDKREISKHVTIKNPTIYYEGLTKESAYLIITFTVFNGSVFRITIDNEIKGSIYLDDDELSRRPKMESSISNYSRYDDELILAIKQWLSPEEAKLISNPSQNSVLKFNRLKITVRGGEDFPGVESQRLSLPASIPIQQPNKLFERIKELESEKTALEEAIMEKTLLEEKVRSLESHWDTHVFTNSWLFAKLETQGQNLGSYVEVERTYLCNQELNKPMLKSVFGIDLLNKSVFDIFIEDKVAGHIEFDGVPFTEKPLIIHNPGTIALGGKGTITIEQRLTRAEADFIASKDLKSAEFILKHLVITIKSERVAQVAQLTLPARVSVNDESEITTNLKSQLEETQRNLEEEKAKNKQPDITGEITEVYFDKNWDVTLYDGKYSYDDFYFTLRVYIANLGATTTIKEFRFVLSANGRIYRGERESLKDYHIKRPAIRGVEPLVDIENSNDVPLEHSRSGWLRFKVTSVQEAEDESEQGMEIELEVIDKYGQPYKLDTLLQAQWQDNSQQRSSYIVHANDINY